MGAGPGGFFHGTEFRAVVFVLAGFLISQVVWQGGRNDEVAIRQPLHEGAGTETVGSMVGKVSFAKDVQARHVAHEIIVHPETSHGVVHGGVDTHRLLVGVFTSDLLIHGEEVAVTLADFVFTETFDGICKIQIHAQAAGADATSVIALLLGGTAGNIAGCQIPEARVFPFQIIVTVLFRNAGGGLATVLLPLRHPAPAVIAQTFGHQGELALIVATNRNAGRMNLGIARIGKPRPALVGTPGGGDVAAHGVGGKVKNIPITTRAEQNRVASMGADLASDHIPDHDAFGMSVHDYQVQHLRAGVHFHLPLGDFLVQGSVGSQQ